jgi:hypothetical protein
MAKMNPMGNAFSQGRTASLWNARRRMRHHLGLGISPLRAIAPIIYWFVLYDEIWEIMTRDAFLLLWVLQWLKVKKEARQLENKISSFIICFLLTGFGLHNCLSVCGHGLAARAPLAWPWDGSSHENLVSSAEETCLWTLKVTFRYWQWVPRPSLLPKGAYKVEVEIQPNLRQAQEREKQHLDHMWLAGTFPLTTFER